MKEWICSCGQKNTSKFCTRCGKTRSVVDLSKSDDNVWTCSCGNKNTGAFCTQCGQKRTSQSSSNDKFSINEQPDSTTIAQPLKQPSPQLSEYPTQIANNKRNYIIIGLLVLIIGVVSAIGYLLQKNDVDNINVAEKNVSEHLINTEKKDKPLTEKNKTKPLKHIEEKVAPVPDPGYHWISDANGVYLWNPEPQDGENITWSGGYVQDGDYKFADGNGTLTWYRNGEIIQVDNGTFCHGRHHGRFSHEFPSGRVDYSNWDNGKEISLNNSTKTSSEEKARQTFINYHRAITNKNYNEAYETLTGEQKRRVGDFNFYVSGFSNTISSEVSELSTISIDDNSITFDYTIMARDKQNNGRVKVQRFKGEAILIYRDSRWFIDYAKSSKVSEHME